MVSVTPATAPPVNPTPVAEQRLVSRGSGTADWVVFRQPISMQDGYTPTDAQRAKFDRLANRWRKDTELSSSVTQDFAHLAFLEILAMGKPALPLILEDLQLRGGHWFLALRLIAEDNPVPQAHAGRVKQMREDWIAWGRQNAYL